MIKSSEEAVEKVLAGLRVSDAPPEMERRILKAVQARASAQSQSGWRWLKPVWLKPVWLVAPAPWISRPLLFGVALMGILAVAAIGPSLYRGRQVGDSTTQFKPTPASVKSVAANSSPVRPSALLTRSLVTKEKRTARPVYPADSVALRELRAASRPAPPLPLTREEKMLSRLAHTAGPEELAALNPEVRARREAEANAEFQQFFGQTTAKQNEQN